MSIRRLISIATSLWVMVLLGLIGAIIPGIGEDHKLSLYGFIAGFFVGFLTVSVAHKLTEGRLLEERVLTPQQIAIDASPIGYLMAFTLLFVALYTKHLEIVFMGIATLVCTTLIFIWASISSGASE